MSCKNYLTATWNIGRNIQFVRRKYVRYSKELSELLLKVNFPDCDIEGWNVVAYFKKPGFVYGKDKAIQVLGETIKNGEVNFDLEGNVLEAFGVWSVEFDLKGLNGENIGSRGAGEDVTYTVVEDVEGTNTGIIPPASTANSVDEMLTKLNEAITKGEQVTIQAGDAEKSLAAQLLLANEGLAKIDPAVKSLQDELVQVAPAVSSMQAELVKFPPAIKGAQDELAKVDSATTSLKGELGKVPTNVQLMKDTASTGIQNIQGAATSGVQNIQSAVSTGVQDVQTATSTGEQSIQTASATGTKSVQDASTAGIKSIQGITASVIKSVQDKGTEEVQNVVSQGTTSVNAIKTQETSSVNAVKAQETTSTKVVADAGTKAVGDVSTEGTAQVKAVSDEGKKQSDLLDNSELKFFAMSKAEFEALQEERKRNNAGSGFKEWGVERTGYNSINHGLTDFTAFSNSLLLGGNVNNPNPAPTSISKTLYPVAIVNGVQYNLSKINSQNTNNIKFPPAPDGTKVYNSATGVVTTHTTSNEAFEGLIENGDFRNGTTGWAGSNGGLITVSDGVLKLNQNTYGNGQLNNTLAFLKNGITYIANIVITETTATRVQALLGNKIIDLHVGMNTFEFNYPTGSNFIPVRHNAQQAGVYTDIASVSIMPITESVITSRRDLCFFEEWDEDIEEKDIVCDTPQYGASTYEGIPAVNITSLGVQQGYSAFGEWDTTTVGRAIRWSTLSNANKKKILGNPSHNIYYDAENDKFIQHRFRIRVIEGFGDNWNSIIPDNESGKQSLNYSKNGKTFIRPRGKNETVVDFTNGHVYISPNGTSTTLIDKSIGHFVARSGLGLDETCVAIPICIVQRLNQGAYHPTYNPEGCATIFYANQSDSTKHYSGKWYQTNVKRPTSKADCFYFGSNNGSDNIMKGLNQPPFVRPPYGNISGSLTGRSDQYKYYDAIYAGQVKDLRLDCKNYPVDEVRETATRKAISGEMRGWDKVPFTKYIVQTGNALQYISPNHFRSSVLYDNELGRALVKVDQAVQISVKGKTDGKWYTSARAVRYEADLRFVDYYFEGLPGGVFDSGADCLVSYYKDDVSYDSLPMQDIICTPENFKATFPNGVRGQWISKMPIVGGTTTFDMNRKNSSGKLIGTYTADSGSTWNTTTQSAWVIDTVMNTVRLSTPINRVALIQYEALSNFTEPQANSKVVGSVGDVFVGNSNTKGNRLGESLTGIIGKSTSAKSYKMLSDDTHVPFKLTDSDGFKALSSVVEKDGLTYLQLNYREEKYDATGTDENKHGDKIASTNYDPAHSVIKFVDKDSTETDMNGATVKVGCHHTMIPLGIAKGGM